MTNIIKVTDIPKFVVDLDKPPSERWNDILDKYQDKFAKINKEFDKIFKMYPTYLLWIAKTLISCYKWTNSIMYYDELESISKKTNIEFEKLLLMQLCYEFCSACTCVVTKVKGEYTFYRTLDWPLDFMKDITIQVNFVRGKKIVFTGITWVGYVGILTGFTGKYAVAVNYRRTTNNSNIWSILGNIKKIITLDWPVGYLVRCLLENRMTFNHAYKYLMHTNLISPCYITMCHKLRKPRIIIRDPNKTVNVIKKDYVVQTNIDPKQFRPNILFSIQRNNLACDLINKNKNNFESCDDLVKGLNKFPIINKETLHYTVMIPKQHSCETYLIN